MTLIEDSQDFCTGPVTVAVTFTPNVIGDHTIAIDGGTPFIYDVQTGVGVPVTVNVNFNAGNIFCDSTNITGDVFANCDPETQIAFSTTLPVQVESCRHGNLYGEAVYPIRSVNLVNGGAGYNNGGSSLFNQCPVVVYDSSSAALTGTGFKLNLTIQSGVITSASVGNIGDGYSPPNWELVNNQAGFQPDPAVVGTPTTKALIQGNVNNGDAYSLPIDVASYSCEPNTGQTDLIIEESYQDAKGLFACFDEEMLPPNLYFNVKEQINNCCCMECKVGVVIVEDIASGSGTMFFQDYGTRKILTRDFDNQLSNAYIFANNTYYEKFDTANDIVDQSLYLGNHTANNGSKLIDSNGALCVGNIHYADCDGPEVFNGVMDECSDTGVPSTYNLAAMGGSIAPFDPSPTFEFYDDYTLTTSISNPSAYQNSVNRKLIIVVTTGANGKKSISDLTLKYETPCPVDS